MKSLEALTDRASRLLKRNRSLMLVLIWSKKVSLPGFSGITIYQIVKFVSGELKKDDIVTRANSVAFSFFLSLFPLIIVVIPLIALTPTVSDWISQAEATFNEFLPQNARNYFKEIIDGIRKEGHYGLRSLSFMFAVIFSSSGMLTLMYGFDKSYSVSFKNRNYLHKRLIATLLTGLLALIVIMSIAIFISGQQIYTTHIIGQVPTSGQILVLKIIKWFTVFFLFYTIISVIYRYGPSIYRPLKFINPGAMLATVSSILASLGFSFFINNFGKYNEIYGSIGALIVLMLWMQINAFIILVGFELNAGIIVNRDRKNIRAGDKKQKNQSADEK